MKKIFLIVFLFATCHFFNAQSLDHKLDEIIKSYHDKYPNIAMSVGILYQGESYYINYGKTKRTGGTTVNEKTLFEIASITKILTTNLIAQAQIEGKLNVDHFIDDYLPEAFVLKENLKNTIKISDLASHQSGLPDIDFRELIQKDPQQPGKSITKEKIISMINQCDTLKDYGEYRYSTVGYILLGQILEQVYMKDYDKIINEKIITPLKLKTTLTKNFNVSNKAIGYNQNGGTQELFNWNIMAPAGLIKSNVTDMMVYLKALLNSKSKIHHAALLIQETYFKNTLREMGLGLNILRDEQNIIYAKSGDSMGQSSVLGYDLTKKWGVIIFINESNHHLRNELFNNIYETLLKF